MKPVDEFLPYKAFVSPCSTCENFNTDPSSGTPLCPRRYWEQQKARYDSHKDVVEPPPYLLATGTDKKDYANPVYFKDGQNILVWVASLKENQATFNADGTLATGSILTKDSFDTKYIHCRQLPVLPEENWAELLAVGVYKEWNELIVTPMREDQTQQDPTQTLVAPPVCKLGGICKRLNFAFFCSLTAPRTDRLRSGT